MTDRDLICAALVDAIGWQLSLADAYRHIPDAPERKEAFAQVRRYRALFRRRYGGGVRPEESTAAEAHTVGLDELRAMGREQVGDGT